MERTKRRTRQPLSSLANAVLVALVALACSSGGHAGVTDTHGSAVEESVASDPTSTPTPPGRSLGPPPTPMVTLTPIAGSSRAASGSPLRRSEATAELRAFDGSGMVSGPRVNVGRSLVISTYPAGPAMATTPEVVSLWDPLTGESRELWTGVAGKQENIFEAGGDWLVTVRTGFSLPFAEWELILHHLDGETRTIARSDPRVPKAEGLHPDLPFGFAPSPSIAGGRVVWEEHYVRDDGNVGKRVNLYDIATGETRTIIQVPDATKEDLRSPSIGGQRVVWIHKVFAPIPGDPSQFDVAMFDLQSGALSTLPISGRPWQIGLTADGTYIAWDDGMDFKYAMNLETGTTVWYAGNPYQSGWGVLRSGSRFSWIPGMLEGGALAGYFDAATGLVREIEPPPAGSVVNIGQPMGHWFVLQDLRLRDEERAASRYFLIPIDGP